MFNFVYSAKYISLFQELTNGYVLLPEEIYACFCKIYNTIYNYI